MARNRQATCPRCHNAGYHQSPDPPGYTLRKPVFVCERCGHVWSSGLNGGLYAVELDRRRKKRV